MKLATLVLNNFKAVRNETIHFDGKDVDMFGPNGAGKSTRGDAVSWLLFGYDLLGRSDCNIKTTDEEGEAIHYLDHSVEGTFLMASGEVVTLKRTYRENWPKEVRGEKAKTFTNHETVPSIDGVECLVGAYNAYIREICPVDLFMTLTNASYFMGPRVTDDQRRGMLFKFFDMTDEQVIEATPEIHELATLRGKLPVRGEKDERTYQKQCQQARVLANKELEALPNQIKGIDSVLPAEDKTDWKAALETHTRKLDDLQREKANLAAGGGATPLNVRLGEIGIQIRTIEAELRNAPNPERSEAIKAQVAKLSELNTLKRSEVEFRADMATAERVIARITNELAASEALRERKRTEWEKARTSVFEGDCTCPTCLQPLPESEVETAKGQFNINKANDVARIRNEGFTAKDISEKLQKDLDRLKDSQAKYSDEYQALVNSIAVMQSEYDAIVIPPDAEVDPSLDPRIIGLNNERMAVQGQLDELTESSEAARDEVNTKIEATRQAINTSNSAIATQAQRTAGLAQIKALSTRQKEVGATVEELDRSLYLCDLFMKAKVDLLTDKINGLFELTYFRLYRKLVKGDWEQCCEVLWRETMAFPSTGQLAQIQLDIIDGLSKFLNFYPPVIIDRAESIGQFPHTGGQQIRLHHMRDETALRIVRDGDAVSNAPKSTETVKELALVF